MDVEKLQRINVLAKELQKHGIAASSDDATAKAEEMINNMTEHEEQSLQDINTVIQADNNELTKEMRRMASQIVRQQEVIDCMQDKMNEIIREINKIQDDVVSQVSASVPVVETSQSGTLPSDPAPAAKNEAPDNPRSGAYKSDDVSIDKFFYFGK